MPAKARIIALSKEIAQHNTRYYRDNTPSISDSDYDALFTELTQLEKDNPQYASPNSPTQRLALEPAKGFEKIKHQSRMLSIDNTYKPEGVVKFDRDMRALSDGEEVEYSAEPKFDGLAISVIYRNGRLFSGATRGDYDEGENVTANVLQIATVPRKIDYVDEIDVRGEVMITLESFLQLNAQRARQGLDEYANPRNAAAGLLRQLDPADTAKAGLVFTAYSITDTTLPGDVQTQSGVLDKLRELGFPVDDNHQVVKGKQGIEDYFKEIGDRRHLLPFDIDGVVIKVNDLSKQYEAGFVSRASRAMMAYKFNEQEASTLIKAIDVQVGRTGAITPVARLSPITLGGVVVQNATLHNGNEIQRLDVRVGDSVIVRRNGDVIPGIISVDKDKRLPGSLPFEMPNDCPCCGAEVAKDKDEDAVMRCTAGLGCPEQAMQNLIYFVSRPAMNIDGVGESLVRKLFESGMVKSPDQLYHLTMEKIQRLEGYGRKSAENAIKAIADSRTPELRKFLVSLGIRNAGDGTAKRLEAAIGDFNAIRRATRAEFESIRDIGPVVAGSLYGYFNDPRNAAMLDRLTAELSIQNPVANTETVEAIAGKVFVITGTLPDMSRDEAKKWIESMGGITSGSVSKKTSFVLAGEEAGGKLDKAKELGVAVIDLHELRVMAGQEQVATMSM